MKILVTGGSGFIGSHIVDKLMEAGHKVCIYDNKAPYQKNICFIKGNIEEFNKFLRSISGIEILFHIAAFSNIDLVKDNALTTIRSNILGTANVLEAARQKKLKRVILASSVYVYGDRGHIYTTAKITSERLCRDYYTLFKLPYTILRFGTAYGPRSRGVDAISIFVQRALGGESLVINGKGDQRRHFIYVEDIARGCLEVLKDKYKNKTYDLKSKESITIKDLAIMVNRLCGNNKPIEFRKSRYDDFKGEANNEEGRLKLVGNMLLKEIGIEEGIKRYLVWYRRKKQ